VLLAAGPGAASAEEGVGYVGARACRGCHEGAYEGWRGSHHDRAMQVADASTVLGDFGGVGLTHPAGTATFSKREGRYLVRTEGADGKAREFRVAYTFGVEPLQQYLVEHPDGRVQVLPFCWDTRPAARGGQRWFHIYGDDPVPPGDPLHWTGASQSWNHMCADCHSTHLRKRYDAASDTFRTRWSSIDVSCEACHGPGGAHVAWAGGPEPSGDPRLAPRFEPVAEARWTPLEATGRPHRAPARGEPREVETCARCHSRRSSIREGSPPDAPLADTHRVSLLEEPLYFVDGQIRDEVYVHGSFVQSRMYAAGVSCSDCHDPHSLELRARGNALCGRCHERERYDAPAHHHHAEGSTGARCVECHMPARTYMQIDARRDHSLRVPRPDLAAKLGTPDACTGCHGDREPAWAAARLAEWRGGATLERHFGEDLHAARAGAPDAGARLGTRIADPATPEIVRATAVSLLPRVGDRGALRLLEAALRDPGPLVRAAAVAGFDGVDPALRARRVGPLLADPMRSVRLEAVRVLAGVPPSLLGPDLARRLDEGVGEFRAVQAVDADRADAHLRLGALEQQRGNLAAAERELQRARELAPWWTPAAVNLADLYRVRGQDEKGEAVLRGALSDAPEDGDLRHALGLLLVRRDRLEEAVAELERAAALRPDNPRYAFVLAVALQTRGDRDAALRVLREALERHPGDRDLAGFRRQLEGGG